MVAQAQVLTKNKNKKEKMDDKEILRWYTKVEENFENMSKL